MNYDLILIELKLELELFVLKNEKLNENENELIEELVRDLRIIECLKNLLDFKNYGEMLRVLHELAA
jgi:hypothetical protein